MHASKFAIKQRHIKHHIQDIPCVFRYSLKYAFGINVVTIHVNQLRSDIHLYEVKRLYFNVSFLLTIIIVSHHRHRRLYQQHLQELGDL